MKYKWFFFFLFLASIIVVFLLSMDTFLLHKSLYAFKAGLGYNGEWQNLLLRIVALLISLIMCGAVLVVVKVFYNKLKCNNLYCVCGGGYDAGVFRA